MEIVKASLKDILLINKLAEQVWEPTYKEILSPEQLQYMFTMMYSKESISEQIVSKGHEYLLVKDDAQYYGFTSYEINAKPGVTKIHKIYVLPNAQGKGVGRILLSAVEKEAVAMNNKVITLNVNRFNKALHFYKKTGFQKVGEEDIDIGRGYLMEDFIMEKHLSL